jgi:hypothetical protein
MNTATRGDPWLKVLPLQDFAPQEVAGAESFGWMRPATKMPTLAMAMEA